MIQQPRFSSHAEQRAMLGSAATIDPDKFPRRWAHQQAREAIAEELVREDQYAMATQLGYERRKKQAERAVFYCDLTLREAAEQMGMGYHQLCRLKNEFGLNFKPGGNGQERKKQLRAS